MTNIKIWLTACRLKTLPAGIAPVAVASIMAYERGLFRPVIFYVTLAAAILIQIATNLANDVFDFEQGADTSDRVGPMRVTQAGLVSPRAMKVAVGLVLSAALLCGIYLTSIGGIPIALIGLLSMLCAVLYTAGPFPLAYHGFGDIFVLIFFGPIATGGTYYLQTFEVNKSVLWVGFSLGMISTALLVVNNIRDHYTDKMANKKTLSVRFGRGFAKAQYGVLLFSAAFIPWLIASIDKPHKNCILASLYLIYATPTFLSVLKRSDPETMIKALERTSKSLILFSVLFCVGWCL